MKKLSIETNACKRFVADATRIEARTTYTLHYLTLLIEKGVVPSDAVRQVNRYMGTKKGAEGLITQTFNLCTGGPTHPFCNLRQALASLDTISTLVKAGFSWPLNEEEKR